MTTKIIPAQIIEDSCHNCPNCCYDSHYSMSYDSGYDCTRTGGGKRIADDCQISQYQEKLDEAERLPLLPQTIEDVNPMSIPDWCPLEDA